MAGFTRTPFTTKSEQGNTIRGLILRPARDSAKLPAIVLSHEFCMNMLSTYRFARKIVKEGYAIFIYDFTHGGTGLSGGSSIGMSAVQQSRDVKAVLDYAKTCDFVDISDITLWGCSQGGFASALIAPEVEDEITKLILYYPALSICDDARRGHMITARFDPHVKIPEKFWCGIVRLGANYITDVIELDPYAQICTFQKPVLILHGTTDHIVDVSYSRKAAEMYPDCEYHEFPGEHMWLGGIGTKKALQYTKAFLKKHK